MPKIPRTPDYTTDDYWIGNNGMPAEGNDPISVWDENKRRFVWSTPQKEYAKYWKEEVLPGIMSTRAPRAPLEKIIPQRTTFADDLLRRYIAQRQTMGNQPGFRTKPGYYPLSRSYYRNALPPDEWWKIMQPSFGTQYIHAPVPEDLLPHTVKALRERNGNINNIETAMNRVMSTAFSRPIASNLMVPRIIASYGTQPLFSILEAKVPPGYPSVTLYGNQKVTPPGANVFGEIPYEYDYYHQVPAVYANAKLGYNYNSSWKPSGADRLVFPGGGRFTWGKHRTWHSGEPEYIPSQGSKYAIQVEPKEGWQDAIPVQYQDKFLRRAYPRKFFGLAGGLAGLLASEPSIQDWIGKHPVAGRLANAALTGGPAGDIAGTTIGILDDKLGFSQGISEIDNAMRDWYQKNYLGRPDNLNYYGDW